MPEPRRIPRTLASLKLIIPSDAAAPEAVRKRDPIVDVLTAKAERYTNTIFLVPCGRAALNELGKQDPATVKQRIDAVRRELYYRTYDGVISLILTMLNVHNIRSINECVSLVDQGDREYQTKIADPEWGAMRKSRDFEAIVELARMIRDEVNGLVRSLANSPEDMDLSRKIYECCDRFRQVIGSVSMGSYVDMRQLRKIRPRYGFEVTNRHGSGGRDCRSIRDFNELIEFLVVGPWPGVLTDPQDFRFNGEFADVFLSLRPRARDSQTFVHMIPDTIPMSVDPVVLHIEGGDEKSKATVFAGLLRDLGKSLEGQFESEARVDRDGRKLIVFCTDLEREVLEVR